jgi:hypothetical protein
MAALSALHIEEAAAGNQPPVLRTGWIFGILSVLMVALGILISGEEAPL